MGLADRVCAAGAPISDEERCRVTGETVLAAATYIRRIVLPNLYRLGYETMPEEGAPTGHARWLAGHILAHGVARRDSQVAPRATSVAERLDEASKIRLQLACAFAAETCNEAVRLVNDVAGTSSIRASQPFERHLRDVHTLSQHASKSSPRYASAGRLMFGLENDWMWLSF